MLGKVTSFDGDRVTGVFIGADHVNRAAEAALALAKKDRNHHPRVEGILGLDATDWKFNYASGLNASPIAVRNWAASSVGHPGSKPPFMAVREAHVVNSTAVCNRSTIQCIEKPGEGVNNPHVRREDPLVDQMLNSLPIRNCHVNLISRHCVFISKGQVDTSVRSNICSPLDNVAVIYMNRREQRSDQE